MSPRDKEGDEQRVLGSGSGDGAAGNQVSPSANSAPMAARERFRRAVRRAGGAAAAAKLLGCSRAYVDLIRKGGRRPGMRIAFAITQAFGIEMKDWMEEGATVPIDECGG